MVRDNGDAVGFSNGSPDLQSYEVKRMIWASKGSQTNVTRFCQRIAALGLFVKPGRTMVEAVRIDVGHHLFPSTFSRPQRAGGGLSGIDRGYLMVVDRGCLEEIHPCGNLQSPR